MRTPIALINDGFEKYPEYYVSRLRIESFLTKIVEKKSKLIESPALPAGKIVLAGCFFGFNSYMPDTDIKENFRKMKGKNKNLYNEPPLIL